GDPRSGRDAVRTCAAGYRGAYRRTDDAGPHGQRGPDVRPALAGPDAACEQGDRGARAEICGCGQTLRGGGERERAETRAARIANDARAHAQRRLALRAERDGHDGEERQKENRSHAHGTDKIQRLKQRLVYQGRRGLLLRPWPPWPAWAGRWDGDAGTAGVAGVAGPPPGLGVAGVALVARVAGVAGVTGRLSSPTASPSTRVAWWAFFVAGVCAVRSAGSSSAGTTKRTRFMQPPN